MKIWSARAKNGIEVHLDALFVDRTYCGLLEGRPNAGLNAMLVSNAILDAQRQFEDWPVHLVAPAIIEVPYPRLPAFRCLGSFQSLKAKDADMHGSALTIVWFQNESIVNGIDLLLEDLEWLSLAKDFEY